MLRLLEGINKILFKTSEENKKKIEVLENLTPIKIYYKIYTPTTNEETGDFEELKELRLMVGIKLNNGKTLGFNKLIQSDYEEIRHNIPFEGIDIKEDNIDYVKEKLNRNTLVKSVYECDNKYSNCFILIETEYLAKAYLKDFKETYLDETDLSFFEKRKILKKQKDKILSFLKEINKKNFDEFVRLKKEYSN